MEFMKKTITLLFFVTLNLILPSLLCSAEEVPPISGAPSPQNNNSWVLNDTLTRFNKAIIDLEATRTFKAYLGEANDLIKITAKIEDTKGQPSDEELGHMRGFCGRLKRHHLIGKNAKNNAPETYQYFDQLCDHPKVNPPGFCDQVALTNPAHASTEKTLPKVSKELRDFCYKPGEQKSPDLADGNQAVAGNNDNRSTIIKNANDGRAPSTQGQVFSN